MNKSEREAEEKRLKGRKASIVIRVDQEVYDQIQRHATPFPNSKRGTPNKVLRHLLDFDEDED